MSLFEKGGALAASRSAGLLDGSEEGAPEAKLTVPELADEISIGRLAGLPGTTPGAGAHSRRRYLEEIRRVDVSDGQRGAARPGQGRSAASKHRPQRRNPSIDIHARARCRRRGWTTEARDGRRVPRRPETADDRRGAAGLGRPSADHAHPAQGARSSISSIRRSPWPRCAAAPSARPGPESSSACSSSRWRFATFASTPRQLTPRSSTTATATGWRSTRSSKLATVAGQPLRSSSASTKSRKPPRTCTSSSSESTPTDAARQPRWE